VESPLTRAARVCLGTIGNNPAVVVAPGGAGHPERLEEFTLGEGGEALAGGTLDQDRHQVVAGVGVAVCLTGQMIEATLTSDDGECVTVGVARGPPRPAGEPAHAAPVAHSAGMQHQVTNGDRSLVDRNLREPLL